MLVTGELCPGSQLQHQCPASPMLSYLYRHAPGSIRTTISNQMEAVRGKHNSSCFCLDVIMDSDSHCTGKVKPRYQGSVQVACCNPLPLHSCSHTSNNTLPADQTGQIVLYQKIFCVIFFSGNHSEWPAMPLYQHTRISSSGDGCEVRSDFPFNPTFSLTLKHLNFVCSVSSPR